MGSKPSTEGGVWYRHDGEDEVDNVPTLGECILKPVRNESDVKKDIGSHRITHMLVTATDAPALDRVAPTLVALRMEYLPSSSQFSSLSRLVQLKELYLDTIDFSNGLPLEITELHSLEMLHLTSCQLKDLPQSLTLLQNLRYLNLSGNKFSHGLPEAIGKLTSLTELSLNDCNLTGLPELDSLVKLERLNLKGNNFSNGLTNAIGKLESLTELNMEFCELTELPTSFSNLSKLTNLNISRNFFSDGLPNAIEKLSSLTKLDLNDCGLEKLPSNFRNLNTLEVLNMQANRFKTCPPEICHLPNIQALNMDGNISLKTLCPEVAAMTKLTKLSIGNCSSLMRPPPGVCRQGLVAIRHYYNDLAKGESKTLPAATVAVIGAAKSGKTSFVRTLQSNERILTGSPNSCDDVSTKVFNFEDVEVSDKKLRFIDFGGQEEYHQAYCLTLRSSCVPVVVVNIEMFQTLSTDFGSRETVRRLFFDWLAHLYLVEPSLQPPKLVITHTDKFSPQKLTEIMDTFLSYSNIVRNEAILNACKAKCSKPGPTPHLTRDGEFFQPEDIFYFGKDNDINTFNRCKSLLLSNCEKYDMEVPRMWKDIESSISAFPDVYLQVDDLYSRLKKLHEVDDKHLETILMYMHYSGKLLWYKDARLLSQFIFPKIKAVTSLLIVLCDHSNKKRWSKPFHRFKNSQYTSGNFQPVKYEKWYQQFKETGIMSRDLLRFLICTESSFTNGDELDVALAILTTFRIIYGPVKYNDQLSYFVPHFAVGYFSNVTVAHSNVQLHVDIFFKGLPPPKRIYHEMAVEVLELYPCQLDSNSVKHNGVKVKADAFTLFFTHNAKAGTAAIQMFGNTDNLDKLWELFVMVVKNTVHHVVSAWKAARFECIFYCAHCKMNGSHHPHKILAPDWCDKSGPDASNTSSKPKQPLCGKEKIPSALLSPCSKISNSDKKRLTKFAQRAESQRELMLKEEKICDCSAMKERLHSGASYSEHKLGDLSKLLEYSVTLTPTNDEAIKILFHNTDRTYKMTSPRGLALVINNTDFTSTRMKLDARRGSEVDVKNMKEMLKRLDFEVHLRMNLSSKEMLDAIDEIVMQHEDEIEDYGAFVLVIMSHGDEHDRIFGADGNLIELKDVYSMLSPQMFPAMSGKPKLVVVQACGGVLMDFGNQGRDIPDVSVPEDSRKPGGMTVRPKVGTRIDHLNTDDLIVIKASFNTYASMRHPEYGSPFISCLVYTFYEHACHEDVEKLCKRIQREVRAKSINLATNDPQRCFGQAPFYFSMLTNYRKFYLFPGYNGEYEDT